MEKNSFLYKSMTKYRFKFLIINVVLTLLYFAFIAWKMPYIKTEMHGSTPLDEAKFAAQTKNFTISEPFELDRHEEKQPTSIFSRRESYWQGDKYFFEMKISNIRETGAVFKSKMSMGQSKAIEYETAKVYLAECGGKTVAIITNPNDTPKSTVKGFLVEKSRPVMSELSKNLKDGESLTLCEYFIDARDLEMETSRTDYFLAKALLIVLVLLYVKLGFYFAKPELTPTYRQLRRYGDPAVIANLVNEQLEDESTVKDGKNTVTRDFIISNSSFKVTVNKNHMAKH